MCRFQLCVKQNDFSYKFFSQFYWWPKLFHHQSLNKPEQKNKYENETFMTLSIHFIFYPNMIYVFSQTFMLQLYFFHVGINMK